MHPLGTPCWLELQPGDLETARSFYTAVLGWSYQPSEAGRWLALSADEPVAALASGGPSPWQPFLRVDDAQDVVERARAAGAVVVTGPDRVGELGTMACITAPGAAPVGLWQPDTVAGFPSTPGPGRPMWFEANSWEAQAVLAFFAGLFGLGSEQLEGMDYHVLRAEGSARYGVLQMTEEWAGMEPSWMSTFAVADIDAAVATARRNGGQVPYAPFDTPIGRTAVCLDPEGTPFTLAQPA